MLSNQKPMKLKVFIELENDNTLTVHGNFFDKTPFSLKAKKYDVIFNEEFLPSKRRVSGWLKVKQDTKQGQRVSCILPEPTIKHGHNISVHEFDLMPLNASIDNFKGPSLPSKDSP